MLIKCLAEKVYIKLRDNPDPELPFDYYAAVINSARELGTKDILWLLIQISMDTNDTDYAEIMKALKGIIEWD